MDEIDIENGEARVETDALTVEEQVKMAYADAYGRDNGFSRGQRCLTFLTDQWVDPETATDLVEFIGPYNQFEPERVSDRIEMVAEDVGSLQIAIGREGSPVMYFEIDPEDSEIVEENFSHYADEFGEVQAPDISNKGVYREEDSRIDEHSMCSHESPPVAPGEEADGDPDANKKYIRMWWD